MYFLFKTGAGRIQVQTPLKAAKPPSIGMTTPVTKPEASAEVSHSSAPIRSSGVPNFPIGVGAIMVLARGVSEPSGLVNRVRFCSGRKKPGARALTRTPPFEKCTASHRVKLLTAALAPL